ncbi:MAG: radical SAM protein [Oscillospiraceae bacterium]|nr:radical SAM protein [Oscillospiraceae bacterium]
MPTPCPLCPHRCPDRSTGLCGETDFTHAHVAKTMLHRWEEPCISGDNGTGAVFFAGCNLSCLFCQNHAVSQARPLPGERADAARLVEIFWSLAERGAENISLISPSHVLPVAREAMRLARGQGFPLKFVWNSNGYETARALQTLQGLVDLYLPDLKYTDDSMALAYSGAPAYFEYATKAVEEMCRQSLACGAGVLVRHLVLPGGRGDSMRALDWIAANAPGARVSLMAQYTPMHRAREGEFPALRRRLTGFEYDSVAEHARALGLQGYFQGREAAEEGYTPVF